MALPAGLNRLALRVIDGVFRPHGTVDRQWCRLVMNDEITKVVSTLPPSACAAVEISGRLHSNRPWRSYEQLSYPEFDVCSSVPERTFDVVICEQVLEHVRDPWAAARTLRSLCRPGGHLIVSTPFLIKVHNEPADYWRFTVPGLRLLLENADLNVLSATSWGNRACVRANFRHWVARRPWQSMQNEELYPIVVWAVARRPLEDLPTEHPAPAEPGLPEGGVA